ncbi:effector-associated constant component EACC1 [Streptomyces sp. PTD9-10]|uniref:effector-associated constant component EACC1 n=1 Tax=Streptomyces sp. PTD9-10 TaxID=3120151 RepID=UPI00300A09A5
MDVHLADGAEDSTAADETRSLLAWLTEADELRGRVAPQEGPPVPGTLGPVLDGLVVALGSGGAVTGLTTALVAWIRSRHNDVTVKATRPDGASLEISTKLVGPMTPRELRTFVTDTSRILESGREADGGAL